MTPPLSQLTALHAAVIYLIAGIMLSSASQVQARTWTSADGAQSFEGELEAYDPGSGILSVTIDGKTGTFNHAILSVADINYLKSLGEFKREKQRPKPVAKAEASAPSTESNGSSVKPVTANKAPGRSFKVHEQAAQLIDYYCIDCHEDGTEKGNMRFDNLESHSRDGWVDTLNKMQEQIHFGNMPPEDEDQFTEEERSQMLAWLSQELESLNANKLEEKLRTPAYGNYVNHKDLFSGEYKDLKPFTPGRRWLISEFIFDAKINGMLDHYPRQNIDGKQQEVLGDNNRKVNITNPFLLPTHSGVRDYANTGLNGGHLLTMITNGKETANHMMYLVGRNHRYLPSVNEILKREDEHKAILDSREKFLKNFIDRELVDIYGDKNESMLPAFVSVVDPNEQKAKDKDIKIAAFHSAAPGQDELADIFHTMKKVEESGDSDAQLIAKCERAWFYYGLNERKIASRVTFLQNYMEDWRKNIIQHKYEERQKPPVYKQLDTGEMKTIEETILAQREKGDRYIDIIGKCMAVWSAEFKQERVEAGDAPREQVETLIEEMFVKVLERSPTSEEAEQYVDLTESYFDSLGNREGIKKLIQTLMLRSDFAYRHEFGEGQEDAFGRKMLSPRDASYAISYALTDSSPDKELQEAAQSGRLNTREDYQREVVRLLEKRDQYYVIDEAVQRLENTASITNQPIRKLRFFREFFGYPQLLAIFKDNKRFGGDYDQSKARLVTETDRLIEHILQNDKDVFTELLTTEDFYVYHSGDNEAMTASSERIRTIYEYFKDLDWENFEIEDLRKHKEFLAKVEMRGVNVKDLEPKGRRNPIREFKRAMESFTIRLDEGETAAAPYVSFPAHGPYNASTRTGLQLRGPQVAKFFNIKLDNWNYPSVQPAKMEHRKGMLTHPAWLIAHAKNTETDPIHRGKWIQEKLLAGTIPDVPITVDAVVPEDHTKTMRQRLDDKTKQPECWGCHVKMNPLGLPFEMYDDFGRFRTEETLEHPDNLIEERPSKAAPHVDLRDIYKTLPVNPKGKLVGTGDPALDGDVKHAIDLAERLGKSDKVRQSIIRYAFRYFMGRNEFLSDSATLIDADRAYLETGGSFDAVIVSLLTSDSFIYRKSNNP